MSMPRHDPPPVFSRPHHRKEEINDRKAIWVWTPKERWPDTWHHTHGPTGADEEVVNGFIFRSSADALEFDTRYPAIEYLAEVSMPFVFASWEDAMMWLEGIDDRPTSHVQHASDYPSNDGGPSDSLS